MIESKIEITKLTAAEGMTLTNGEAYGKEIYLGKYDSPNNWYEITDAEYDNILAEQGDTLSFEN
jgi:hypothetical protein